MPHEVDSFDPLNVVISLLSRSWNGNRDWVRSYTSMVSHNALMMLLYYQQWSGLAEGFINSSENLDCRSLKICNLTDDNSKLTLLLCAPRDEYSNTELHI